MISKYFEFPDLTDETRKLIYPGKLSPFTKHFEIYAINPLISAFFRFVCFES